MSKSDRTIIALLSCILRWRDVRGARSKDGQAIHGAAKAVFDVASAIVSKADKPDPDWGAAERFLVAEMRRRMKEIYDEERGWPGPLNRAVGVPMYTPKERK